MIPSTYHTDQKYSSQFIQNSELVLFIIYSSISYFSLIYINISTLTISFNLKHCICSPLVLFIFKIPSQPLLFVSFVQTHGHYLKKTSNLTLPTFGVRYFVLLPIISKQHILTPLHMFFTIISFKISEWSVIIAKRLII